MPVLRLHWSRVRSEAPMESGEACGLADVDTMLPAKMKYMAVAGHLADIGTFIEMDSESRLLAPG